MFAMPLVHFKLPITLHTILQHSIYERRTVETGSLLTESILELSHVMLEDAGQYSCTASSGPTSSATNVTQLTVFSYDGMLSVNKGNHCTNSNLMPCLLYAKKQELRA